MSFSLSQRRLSGYPAPQFVGIRQFLVAVTDLEPAEVELEAFRYRGSAWTDARQRSLARRIIVNKHGHAARQFGFDDNCQEEIAPTLGIVGLQSGRSNDFSRLSKSCQLRGGQIDHGCSHD